VQIGKNRRHGLFETGRHFIGHDGRAALLEFVRRAFGEHRGNQFQIRELRPQTAAHIPGVQMAEGGHHRDAGYPRPDLFELFNALARQGLA